MTDPAHVSETAPEASADSDGVVEGTVDRGDTSDEAVFAPRPAEGPGDRAPLVVTSDDDQGEGTRAVVASLLVNVVSAVAKFAGFLVTRSASLLAGSLHSAADSGHQALVLLGGRRVRRAAEEEHPFGYGRERYYWAFVVGVVLFGLGAAGAIYEGLRRIDDPQPLRSPEWAFAVLGFAVVAQAVSLRFALRRSRALRGQAGYRNFVRRARRPELPVVLLEGVASMVGVSVALGGVTASVVTDDARWDGYATVAVGVLLALVAIVLVVELKSLLVGASASRKDVEAMRAAIEIEPEVIGVMHLRAEHIGPDELLVGAKVEFLHDLSVIEVAAAIDRVETNIRNHVPAARVIYLEPDVHRDHRAAAFVADNVGHIDPADPDYEAITGRRRTDDEIWS